MYVNFNDLFYVQFVSIYEIELSKFLIMGIQMKEMLFLDGFLIKYILFEGE